MSRMNKGTTFSHTDHVRSIIVPGLNRKPIESILISFDESINVILVFFDESINVILVCFDVSINVPSK